MAIHWRKSGMLSVAAPAVASSFMLPRRKAVRSKKPPGRRTLRASARKRRGELNHWTVEADAIRSKRQEWVRQMRSSASQLVKRAPEMPSGGREATSQRYRKPSGKRSDSRRDSEPVPQPISRHAGACGKRRVTPALNMSSTRRSTMLC